MECSFIKQHMWDSLKREYPTREKINAVLAKVKEEFLVGRLPFLSFPHFEELRKLMPRFEEFFKGKENLLLIGIGGSCVGSKALTQLLAPEQECGYGEKRIFFIENVDSLYMDAIQKNIDATKTCILTISKSGNTIETVTQYLLLKQWLQEQCKEQWDKHCAIITDNKEGFLYKEAEQNNLLQACIPCTMGGRYSVLSAVGIIPMLFLGKDYTAFMQGAVDCAENIINNIETIENNPLWDIIFWQYSAEKQNFVQTIFFSYIPRSSQLGLWFMQLWAESLGKQGKGTFPIFAQGVVDQHSLQQMFLDGKKQGSCIFISVQEKRASTLTIKTDSPSWAYINGTTLEDILFAEYQGTVQAFIKEGIPHMEYVLKEISEYTIGELFVFWQSIVCILGYLLEINPLDQPAVEYGKRITTAILQNTISSIDMYDGSKRI